MITFSCSPCSRFVDPTINLSIDILQQIMLTCFSEERCGNFVWPFSRRATWNTNIEKVSFAVEENKSSSSSCRASSKLTYQLWLSCIHTQVVFKLWNWRREDKHISFSSDRIKLSLPPHALINLMSGYYNTQSIRADGCEQIAKEEKHFEATTYIWFLYANIYAPSATVNSKATQARLRRELLYVSIK